MCPDKVVLKQTFIKVKPGNNYAEDQKQNLEMAQKRIDAGWQSGWHLWEVSESSSSIYTFNSRANDNNSNGKNRESWLKMRKEAVPSMIDSDWRTL